MRDSAVPFSPSADYSGWGDSMVERILDGDLLAVHRTTEANNGDIVVARIEDEVIAPVQAALVTSTLLPENWTSRQSS